MRHLGLHVWRPISQVELFLAAVVGLGLGNFLFNVNAPVSSSVDPCCPDGEPSIQRSSREDDSECMPSQLEEGRTSLRQPLLASEAPSASREPQTPSRTPPPLSAESVALRVEGMTCMHCVAAVEDALKEVSGVTDASVDLESKQAEVRASPS